MNARLTSFLQIRTGEARMVALLATLFAVVEAGRGFGANAADALFFLRFGVQFLPYMFMLLGAATFVTTIAYTAALSRLHRGTFYVGSLGLFAVFVLLEWAAIHLEAPLLYPALWITINVINTVLGLQLWHVVGEVTDTRQAKRLYSIFISGGILGSLIGNVATGRLAQLFGTQNLLVLYAVLLLISFALTIEIARRLFQPMPKTGRRVGVWTQMREGFNYERSSRMLLLLAFASVVFSVLYFSIAFPFSKVVSASFPKEADVAGFLGLFSAVATLITLLVSLVVANRLYARIGIVNAVLVLPLIYLGGFILWTLTFSLATSILVRLAQLVVLGGLASPAWNALFNVAPPERRGEVLGFDAAVPAQIGVVLSGVLLILGDRVMNSTQIFVMGVIVALVCAYLVWQMRRAYGEALVAALRAGRFEVFSGGTGAFARFRGDANAFRVVSSALQDTKASIRRLAIEIMAKMNSDSAIPALINALNDPDAEVRLAALRALGALDAPYAADSVVAKLSDREPAVRECALEVLVQLESNTTPALLATLRQMLLDRDSGVRAQTAVALAKFGEAQLALPALDSLLGDKNADVRVRALNALGKIAVLESSRAKGNGFDITPLLQATHDQMAVVRRAACQTLGWIRDDAAIEPLITGLNDPDPTVRDAGAESLRRLGAKATPRVLRILREGHDRAQDAALNALLPDDPQLVEPLSGYAQRQVAQVQTWRALAVVIPRAGRVTQLVRELLRSRAAQSELRLVKAVGLLGHREVMDLVARSLKSHEAETRAEAIETLETLGDKRLAKAIIPLLDNAPATQPDQLIMTPAEALAHLMTQNDDWARALAARAAAELELRELIPNLRVLQREDRDPLPRQAAREALIRLNGAKEEAVLMETLQTVSSLERILLLREVPLFAELSPDDLKQIAEIAREQLYPDGAVLCREGEEGNELYVLASGQVRVIKKANGTEKVLATRGVGEFVGEMAIIESAPRYATVRAVGDVRTLVIDANAFKSILRDRPEVSLAVLRALSRRLREVG